MATRFRLPASGTPVLSPALQSYTHAASVSRVPLPTADTTALANLTLTPDAADDLDPGDTFFRQFISGPLAPQAFTSGDAFKYAVQVFEANAGNNLQVQIWMGIYSGDGTTLRGEIRSKVAEGTEINTSLRNVFYSGTLSNTVNALDGDRLVIEFSLTGDPTASGGTQGHNGTMRFGSNGASGDLPENDTETGTTFNPWIEFNVTVQPIQGLRRYRTTQVIAASDVATTTYTITCTDPTTGATFQPVAVIAHYSGRSSTGAGEGSTMWGRGVAVSATSRRSSVWHAVQASATIDNQGANRDDALITEIDATPAVTGLVDVDAFLGDGFRLIVDDQLAADILVELEAIGGDLTCAIATITAPAGTGDQDINVGLDLTGGLDNKGVLFFGPGLQVSTINNVAGGNGHAELGMAAGDTVAQWAMCWRNVSAGATSDTLRYMRSGECIASNSSGASPNLRASLTTWLSTGFRLNWAETASGQLIFALAIKGQRWYAGTDETRTDTNTEQILTAYKPLLMFAASHCTTESASDTFQDHVKVSIGVAVSASSRACISMVDADNLADSDIAIGFHTDRIYNNFDESNADKSTIIGAMDVSSFDNNGVTFVMDDADPSAAFFGWLIGADERYAAVTMPAIASGSTLAAPTVAVTVVGGTIASGNTRFAPEISQTGGPQAVTTGTIASGNQRFAPTVALFIQEVTGAHIASTAALYAPIVSIHISNLVDAFPGPSINTDVWDPYQSAATTSIVGGRLRIASDTGRVSGPASGGIISVGVYDLTDGEIIIQAFPSDNSAFTSTDFLVENVVSPNEMFFIFVRQFAGTIIFEHNGDEQVETWDPVQDVWWRIRHDQATNKVHLETAPDGLTWTSRRNETPTSDITNMAVYISAGWTFDNPANETPAEFDNVNVPPQPITGGTIAAGSTLSAPSVQHVVTTGTVAIGSALFAPTITVGAVSVTTGTIASGSQLFAPTVTPGAVAVTTGTIAAGSALFAPTVTPVQSVINGTIASGSALFAPTIAVGAVTVVGGTIGSTLVLSAPSVAYVVATGTISSGSALFAPTLAYAVTTGTIAAGSTLFAPSLAYAVTTGTIASGSALFAPSIAAGAVTVIGAHVASTATLFPPDVTISGAINAGHVASTLVLYAPTVIPEEAVTTGFIAAGTVLFPPTVIPEQFVTTGTITSTLALFAPTVVIEFQVTTGTVGSTVALFGPAVLAEQEVTGGTIAAGTALYPPSVGSGITAGTIGSTAALYAPTLAYVVTTGAIAGTVLYAPTIVDEKLVIVAFIPSGAVLYGPGVFVGIFADVINIEVSLRPALGMTLSTRAAVSVEASLRRSAGVDVYVQPTES